LSRISVAKSIQGTWGMSCVKRRRAWKSAEKPGGVGQQVISGIPDRSALNT